MDRINSDNVGYDAQGRCIFKDGPPATTLNGPWCTGVQEELMSVIESEGFAGNVSDNTLLLKAITAAIARATDNYVTVHDLGTKNILSAYSSFNLDLYISGGALAKPSGWRCRVGCSDGNGSYYCDLSTTYNIKGIAVTSAVSALNFRMYGTGNYLCELDNTNSKWNIIEDNTEAVLSVYTNSATTGAAAIIDFDTKVTDKYNCVTIGASWKWTCPRSGEYVISSCIRANAAGTMLLYKARGSLAIGMDLAIGLHGTSTWSRYIVKDEYLDFRSTGTTNGTGNGWISILEVRR